MREVNFSIPNVNKASVGITTALYDRRALDCTSTLPLINSLNHLAYLTTSSARIRDILTVDGGVERLVCILKQGRSKDMMDMWKWNLAFQCVVNIGVRGSENVRTRVVEADMVPVIATILDNYIKVIDKFREKAESEAKRSSQRTERPERGQNAAKHHSSTRSREHRGSFINRAERAATNPEHRSFRRQAPPASIEIPVPFDQNAAADHEAMDITPTAPQFPLTSPPERTPARPRYHHHHHRSHDGRHHFQSMHHAAAARNATGQPLPNALPSMDVTDGFGLRPVRDIDRLPSMVPGFPSGLTSQPESPTTPTPPVVQGRPATARASSTAAARSRRRPSIRHSRSMSGESDDAQGEEMASDESAGADNATEPLVDIRPGVDLQAIAERDSLLEAVDAPLGLNAPNASDTQDVETFNITHRSAIDGSLINANTATTTTPMAFSPPPPAVNTLPPTITPTNQQRYLYDRANTAGILSGMPRDEDILLALQLLAYVSKYCNLRSYFQKSHLVPKLKIGAELNLIDGGNDASPAPEPANEDDDEEYLVPDDFNIFPLVEKFTPRHHPPEMHTWAGVVMRNLCRKDDSRGGTRQCAYYQCGKWEEYTRQFAKCRRCRRTKYCSKECQKSAWVYHRHWCIAAPQ
ncbi:MAG: hypothetical protein M4579_006376 [Chaenotheca gracillima]|nr:MAG: hypothetical protein M4579_006376 [Chaenotheca gracillima]